MKTNTYISFFFALAAVGVLSACSGSSPAAAQHQQERIPGIEIPLETNCSSVEGAVLTTDASSVPAACVVDSWLAGSTQLCQGRHIYRDYVYDDHGADTGQFIAGLSGPAGDQSYPAGQENTADFVNLQLWVVGDRLHMRAELNTLFDAESTVFALAIDTDNNPATGGGQWCDINVASDGWDVLQALRVGNVETNVIEGQIPLPEGDEWRIQAVLAQADGTVMNVAYRGIDERSRCAQTTTAGDSTAGCFFEDNQSIALGAGDISGFGAEISVVDLGSDITTLPTPVTTGLHSRVYTSDFTLPPGEGLGLIAGRGDGGNFPIAAQEFVYLGKYQPYAFYLPETGNAPYPLQMVWHGSSTIHGFMVNQVGFQQAVGEQFGRILASPLARGPDGYGSDISERDLLDVMEDVESHFEIDLDRVISSGYSQGGYLAYRMAALYPHRFAGFTSWVGFTGDDDNGLNSGLTATAGAVGNIIDFIGNLRNIPGSMIYAGADELVHVWTANAMQQAFDATDNIYRWYMHPAAEHLGFALVDNWDKEATDSANYQRVLNPVRVTFRHDPTIGNPEYNINHDRAYWISDIRNREVGADHLAQVYGDIDLSNHSCGGDVPIAADAFNAGPLPFPWTSIERNEAGRLPVAADNFLEGSLTNIESLTIDAAETCNVGQALRYSITTDGPAEIIFSDGRRISLADAGTFNGQI